VLSLPEEEEGIGEKGRKECVVEGLWEGYEMESRKLWGAVAKGIREGIPRLRVGRRGIEVCLHLC